MPNAKNADVCALPIIHHFAFIIQHFDHTRLTFLGRGPLWGIGVMSLMNVTFMPRLASARMADSRPEPTPFTRTMTSSTPARFAFSTTVSATRAAANGVAFFVPLKPIVPADDQASTAPRASVSVIIVLL